MRTRVCCRAGEIPYGLNDGLCSGGGGGSLFSYPRLVEPRPPSAQSGMSSRGGLQIGLLSGCLMNRQPLRGSGLASGHAIHLRRRVLVQGGGVGALRVFRLVGGSGGRLLDSGGGGTGCWLPDSASEHHALHRLHDAHECHGG